MPDPFSALSAGSALLGASSASKAAKAQSKAADQQVALQREIYDDQTQRFAPFLEGGTTAQNALMYELGLGSAPMIGATAPEITTTTIKGDPLPQQPMGGDPQRWSPSSGMSMAEWTAKRGTTEGGVTYGPDKTTYGVGGKTFNTLEEAQAWANANKTGGKAYGGFTKTPGYDFRLGEGQRSLEAGLAARGGLYSGAAMKALNRYGQDYASNEYGNYLARLTGAASGGQAAAGMQANAGANFAANATGSIGAKGDAQSAGAIGVGNALLGGINNGVGLWQYMKAQQPNQSVGWPQNNASNAMSGQGMW